MNATIVIDGLRTSAIIGVYDWERQVPQELLIDIRMEVDIDAAVRSDAVADAHDYGALCDLLKAQVQTSRFRLLESLAAHLLAHTVKVCEPARCDLTVHKPGAVPTARDITVTVSTHA